MAINPQTDTAAILPIDVFKGDILTKLDPQSLSRCCQVSRLWNQCASDDRVWKKLFDERIMHLQFFDGRIMPLPQTNIKKFIIQNGVISINGLVACYQKLLQELKPGTTISFTCLFSLNDPGIYKLEKIVGIMPANPTTRDTAIIFRTIFFMNKLPQNQNPYKDLSNQDMTDHYFYDLNIIGEDDQNFEFLKKTIGSTKMIHKALKLPFQQTKEQPQGTLSVRRITILSLMVLGIAGIYRLLNN